jgi:hypothetical protein
MYSIDQIRRGFARSRQNPAFVGRELNRLFHRRSYQREFNTRGVDVMEEEWDNLLILDACRFDDFADLHDLPGELETRRSRGSHTAEFLRGNFDGRDLLDTVYVTASPQLHYQGIDARFHAVDYVWDGDGWDDDAGTVLPETMVERALAAADSYPENRLIVHFIQPHYPFLGASDVLCGSVKDRTGRDIWGALMHGEYRGSPEEIRAAYRRNLEIVLPSVRTLLANVRGRTVVTSDHGNMFGERAFPVPIREWGHPPGVYTEELVTVPWLVSENGHRTIVEDRSETGARSTAEEPAEDEARDRLRQLGYVE